MSRSPALARRRITMLAVMLAALAAVLLLVPPRPAVASICPAGCYAVYSVTYYSGPEHKKQVGECVAACDGETCTGMETDYFLDRLSGCCCNNGN